MDAGRVRIGTSGWTYDHWQGAFYPDGLAKRRRLEHLATRLDAAEINGTFYSLQRASTFRRWAAETGEDFRFAVKGSRYITHMKRLHDVEEALGRFLASGPLALREKLGPVLWQLPPATRWDAELIGGFLAGLPRTTVAAAERARPYADRVRDPCTEVDVDRPLRHALEVRHPSFRDPAVVRTLRDLDVSLVVSDGAGEFPRFDDVTADPVYVRLHGDAELYRSGYSDDALADWAARIGSWAAGESSASADTIAPGEPAPAVPRDVWVFFDNDGGAHAPRDALALTARTRGRTCGPPG
ncbi:DUF72 domain-containing protein [Actinomycetospora corticicola]|uniref:Uncharacterized protein YecE (DUF72 family) n=1 Tax=Actinomycetospora corticicola TaxID=663602 RepID=A0A7Y9DUV3_9PSEU|nr:DUF72 domain-containing protein [Actinomycetospora corticicola]NYD35582.1 uncharacterized protein YecE (DUF72 family) [Actinomycetospora corticicola]